jgi:TPR repeat protein
MPSNDRSGLFVLILVICTTFGEAQSTSQQGFLSNQALAQEGVAQAQLTLGLDYMIGTYIPRDYVTSMSWLQKASAQQLVTADAWIGSYYLYGHGVAKDLSKAASLELKAASAHDATGLMFFGILNESGAGVAKDMVHARALYEESAELNNARAMDLLGVLYLHGDAVPKSSHDAEGMLTKSAGLGDSWGELHLANALREGKFGKIDLAQALTLYTQSANQGNRVSQYQLGHMYDED